MYTCTCRVSGYKIRECIGGLRGFRGLSGLSGLSRLSGLSGLSGLRGWKVPLYLCMVAACWHSI